MAAGPASKQLQRSSRAPRWLQSARRKCAVEGSVEPHAAVSPRNCASSVVSLEDGSMRQRALLQAWQAKR